MFTSWAVKRLSRWQLPSCYMCLDRCQSVWHRPAGGCELWQAYQSRSIKIIKLINGSLMWFILTDSTQSSAASKVLWEIRVLLWCNFSEPMLNHLITVSKHYDCFLLGPFTLKPYSAHLSSTLKIELRNEEENEVSSISGPKKRRKLRRPVDFFCYYGN